MACKARNIFQHMSWVTTIPRRRCGLLWQYEFVGWCFVPPPGIVVSLSSVAIYLSSAADLKGGFRCTCARLASTLCLPRRQRRYPATQRVCSRRTHKPHRHLQKMPPFHRDLVPQAPKYRLTTVLNPHRKIPRHPHLTTSTQQPSISPYNRHPNRHPSSLIYPPSTH
ncbi:hypothetical protein M3J09_008025 [Ascochyta lentis]